MLDELKKIYEAMFQRDVPTLVNTDIPDDKLIELLKNAIIEGRPLTLDDLAEVVGEFDLIEL